jgi:hypothetical protein
MPESFVGRSLAKLTLGVLSLTWRIILKWILKAGFDYVECREVTPNRVQ